MSAQRQTSYRMSLVRLAMACGAVWILAGIALVVNRPANLQYHSAYGDPVLPDFAEQRSDVQLVRFTLADDSYSLLRTSSGWVMPESGEYPVRRDQIAALMSGFETLTYDVRRTADPYKHDLLGLGDPAEGGNGVLVEFLSGAGETKASLIVGRRNDQIYLRRAGSDQTFRATGELPPFYNSRAWLDFDIISIAEDAIRSVRIFDVTGESVYLRRDPGDSPRSFRPAPPFQDDRVRSTLGVSGTALAITRLQILDAKPARELTRPAYARHITETFDGLEIELLAHAEPDGNWVTLRAVEAGEGARRAQAINDKAEGWAFELSDYDIEDFTPLVADLVIRDANPPGTEPDGSDIED